MRVSVLISALASTSCTQDFSQFGVVVAHHIPHSSSSQCHPPHLVWCVRGTKWKSNLQDFLKSNLLVSDFLWYCSYYHNWSLYISWYKRWLKKPTKYITYSETLWQYCELFLLQVHKGVLLWSPQGAVLHPLHLQQWQTLCGLVGKRVWNLKSDKINCWSGIFARQNLHRADGPCIIATHQTFLQSKVAAWCQHKWCIWKKGRFLTCMN